MRCGGQTVAQKGGEQAMVQLKAKRVDDGTNSDMVLVFDMRGCVQAIVHVDCFWEGAMGKGEIHEELQAGEELILNVTIGKET